MTGEHEVSIVEVGSDGPLLRAGYREVLVPSFPPDELGPVEGLIQGVEAGTTRVLAAVEMPGQERPLAVAVGEYFPGSGVVLLSYLASRPGQRSAGLGATLLSHALAAWTREWSPRLIVLEVEHPAAHAGSEAYGDPAARVRFYARNGARPLDVPYFQPPVRPGGPRVRGLMLCAFAAPGTQTVDSAVLSAFLTEYLGSAEGRLPTDSEAEALLAAAHRPGGVRLLSFEDLASVPYAKG